MLMEFSLFVWAVTSMDVHTLFQYGYLGGDRVFQLRDERQFLRTALSDVLFGEECLKKWKYGITNLL